MTSTSGNLNSTRPSLGNVNIVVGKGAMIPITKTVNTYINTSTQTFGLK